MPIITYWNTSREQTGQTMAAVATATNMAIQHNLKILLISTSLNDDTIKKCFWHEKGGLLSGIFGTNVSVVNQNGIEGLDRIVRSNKISPDIIKDYTKVVLKNRLEVLLGLTGTEEQYNNITKQYLEIIVLANKYYDFVIVDLDRNMGKVLQKEILKRSDIIIPVISQRLQTLDECAKYFSSVPEININNVLYAIGKYDGKSKYNAKNISRNILKSKDVLNTIPYNTLFFEAAQEGNMVDLLLDFKRLKGKDENTEFLSEITRLIENIKIKVAQNQNRK